MPRASLRTAAFTTSAALFFLARASSATESLTWAEPPGTPAKEIPAPAPETHNGLPMPSGLVLGGSAGLAHPGGWVGGGSPATTPRMSDIAQTWVPLSFDAGYLVSPGALVGVSLVWGPLLGEDTVSASCAACGFRYDLQAIAKIELHPFPNATIRPRVSLGAGWELLHLAFSDASSPTVTYQGPVLADLEVGLDVRSRAVTVGPYFGFAVAEFVARSLSPTPPNEPSIDAHTVHEWFSIGIRGSYGPFLPGQRSTP